MGIVKGVTTNPSLLAKEIRSLKEKSGDSSVERIIKNICSASPLLPVSVEVTAENSDEMVRQGLCFSEWSPQVVVKIPLTDQGLKACFQLTTKGIPVNVTLCFSLIQAFLAAKAGATYISIFLGRLQDNGQDAFQILQETYQMLKKIGSSSKLLAASVRTLDHVYQSLLAGIPVATVPFSVLQAMLQSPLTDKGLKQFQEDSKIFSSQLSLKSSQTVFQKEFSA
ncbi:putative transaldolase [Holospora undulata HU1]|uniref:Putative transaldolase n=3 Tax=Holosporaceae TaxID=44746 RepID=A0A061JHY3_9PROT|nr:putative transaldolase [Holospora undulata HU1]GAJ46337.1 putative transaldolase [Holospora elegans E1]